MKNFTTFGQYSATKSVRFAFVRAKDLEQAKVKGREECAKLFNTVTAEIEIVGVMAGHPKPVYWESYAVD
jgi:hypothetical protein